MKTIIKTSLVTLLLAACVPSESIPQARLMASPPSSEEPVNEEPVIDQRFLNVVCFASENSNLQLDLRTMLRVFRHMPSGQEVVTTTEFYKSFSDPTAALLAAGLSVEHVEANRDDSCAGETSSDLTGVDEPENNSDVRIVTGTCQTGQYKNASEYGENPVNTLNMADEHNFIIVPSAELREKFAEQMSCETESEIE